MDLGLSGRKAIVTGGSRGIGKAILLELVREGAVVATCARNEDTLVATASEVQSLGGTIFTQALDVRDRSARDEWLSEAVQQLGGLDILISNVSTRVDTKSETWWQDSFDVDLNQHVETCKQVLPALQDSGGGSVVFIASIASVLTQLPPDELAYGSMKAALVNYSGQMAVRLASKGVRVNCVSPGPIHFEGGFWDHVKKQAPEFFELAGKTSAMGRHGTPEEVSRAVAFLASPAASYITGANLRIDGAAVKAANF